MKDTMAGWRSSTNSTADFKGLQDRALSKRNQHSSALRSIPCLDHTSEIGGKEKLLPKLHGDVSGLELVFVQTRRRLIGTTVPESIYFEMQKHPGSLSGFYEDSISSFDGNIQSLLEASVVFVKNRKMHSRQDPIRNANGRVFHSTYNRVIEIEEALNTIHGISRSKVLAGIIQLYLNQMHKLYV